MKIDHIYCINLERSTERRKSMQKQFAHNGLDVEFFPAVDGKAIGKDGAFGCAQSHKYVWVDIIKNNYKNCLILEDDVILNKQLKNVLEILREPVNWDILYLGGSIPIKKGPVDGDFTPCKILGTWAYIVNAESALRLASMDMENIDMELDIAILEMKLKTFICNHPIAHAPEGGLGGSDIGVRLPPGIHRYIIYYIEWTISNFWILFPILFLVWFYFVNR